MSPRRLLWAALLAVAALAFSAHYSRLAPCGSWTNAIFGEQAWGEEDPGAFYFASAHELAWGEAPLFLGHPGATLTPLLRGIQEALYRAAGDEGVSFTRFIAQHLPEAFLLSKLAMTLLHLLSFVALHALAKEILPDRRAATIATLGYATSFPVLYYLSRISVEPVMVLCLASAFWATWRAEDRGRRGRLRAAVLYAGLAGLAAVSGAASKLVFLGPLPLFLALHLAADGGRMAGDPALPRRVRVAAVAGFSVAALAALGLYSGIVDWPEFFRAWSVFAATERGGWELAELVPGLGASRIFLSAELGFSLLAALGWGHFLLRRPRERRRALWLSAYGGYGLAGFGYRVALEGSFLPFHYAFVALTVGAVFFGWASLQLASRLGLDAGRRGAPALALWLAILHGLGALAVVDARRHDALAFARHQPFFPLLAGLAAGERLGVGVEGRELGQPLHDRLVRLHGFVFPSLLHPRPSALRREIESLVVPIPARRAAEVEPGAGVPVLEARVVRLPARRTEGGGGL